MRGFVAVTPLVQNTLSESLQRSCTKLAQLCRSTESSGSGLNCEGMRRACASGAQRAILRRRKECEFEASTDDVAQFRAASLNAESCRMLSQQDQFQECCSASGPQSRVPIRLTSADRNGSARQRRTDFRIAEFAPEKAVRQVSPVEAQPSSEPLLRCEVSERLIQRTSAIRPHLTMCSFFQSRHVLRWSQPESNHRPLSQGTCGLVQSHV